MAEWEVMNSTKQMSGAPTNLKSPVSGHGDIEERQHCGNTSASIDKTGKLHISLHFYSTLLNITQYSLRLSGKAGAPVGSMCWSRRRHARRVYEIGQTFSKVFGAKSLGTGKNPSGRVRMIYASWGLENNFQTYYNDTLMWLAAEYGPVDEYLYAMSYAQYFAPSGCNDGHCAPGEKATFNYSTATIPEVIDGYMNATTSSVEATLEFVKMAKTFGVKTVSYEGAH